MLSLLVVKKLSLKIKNNDLIQICILIQFKARQCHAFFVAVAFDNVRIFHVQ
jgi:hypothetical protein